MSQSNISFNIWTLPTLALWLVFFIVGLLPESAYWAARVAGGVVTQNAIINSPSLVTLFLALYLAFFAHRRCLDAGVSRENALARAIQVGILALIAFLPYPFYLLLAPGNLSLLGTMLRNIDELAAVFGLPVAKLLAWGYLLLTVVRSQLPGGDAVFARMYPKIVREGEGNNLDVTLDE